MGTNVNEMVVNQIPVTQYGASLQLNFSVSGTPIDNQYFKGRNRSSFVLLASVTGMKTLTLPLVFVGDNTHEIARNKSNFDLQFTNKVEIGLPDGYEYTCIAQDMGELAYIGDRLATCTYGFIGIQHGRWVTTTGPSVFCESTAPVTDCIFQTTVSQAADTYNLSGFVFNNVESGMTLEVDGINKKILVNGEPGAQYCNFLQFPYLTPGQNQIVAPDPVTVSFWPIFI